MTTKFIIKIIIDQLITENKSCTAEKFFREKILWFIIFQHLVFQYFGAKPSSGNCVDGEGCLDG